MKNVRLTVAASCLFPTLLAAAAGAPAQQPPGGGEKCPSYIVVEGAVRTPTRFEPPGEATLSKALAAAGGVTEDASGKVRVTHAAPVCGAAQEGDDSAGERTQDYDLVEDLHERKLDPPLRPGDVVTVERASLVYITGGVRQPVALYLRPSLTVKQAVAMAGGLRRDADPEKVRIYRRAPGSTDPAATLSVNLKAIGKEEAEDLELQANDILWVPCRGCGSDPSPLPAPQPPLKSGGSHGIRVIY